MHVRLGSKVYYKDNGPEDTGVIVDIILTKHPFVVKWDRQEKSEFKKKRLVIPEFGIDSEIEFNPADENIDEFDGDQLVLVEY
jgi:hypothetical protein